VEFHCSLGLAKFRPIKDAGTQVNNRSIDAEQFILETEFMTFLNRTTSGKQLVKDGLIDLPGAVGISVSEAGTFHQFRP
jgi:hypothetical protein